MAKPSTAADWEFIANEREEEIQRLKRDVKNANFELTNSRKEVERLKSVKLELEDQVVDYRADVSKWKTLVEQGGGGGDKRNGGHHHQRPQGVGNIEHQRRQMDDMKRQLSAVCNERNGLAEQLRNLQLREQSRPDNPLPNHEAEVLRMTLQQRIQDITRILKENDELRKTRDDLNTQLKQKDDDIAGLRKQVLEATANPPPTSPQQTNEMYRLRDENRRLSGDCHKLGNDNRRLSLDCDSLSTKLKDIEEKNVHLHQQNMIYEDDYRREKDERQLMERRLTAAQDENRNLQAIIDAVNQGGGGNIGGGRLTPPP